MVVINQQPGEDDNNQQYEVAIADPPLIQLDGEFGDAVSSTAAANQCAIQQQHQVVVALPIPTPIEGMVVAEEEEINQPKKESSEYGKNRHEL